MVEMLEGVGNEVVWSLFALVVIAVVCLAWMSTGIAPIEYYVWLIQMYIYPNRRIVQVLHMDHEDAGVLESHLAQHNRSTAVERNAASDSPPEGAMSREQNSPPGEASVRHWEMEISENSEGTDGASPSGALHHTLRRRALLNAQSTSGSDERSIGSLLVSRVPLQIQQDASDGDSSSPSALLSTAASSLRSVSEERSQGSSPAVDSESSPETVTSENPVSSPEGVTLPCQKLSPAAPLTVASEVRSSPPSGELTETSAVSTSIKLKFLDDTQICASTALEATVGQFKRRYFWESMLAGKVVRLIYRGQLLRDDSRSLSSYGLHDKCVLHCHVSSTPYAQPAPNFSVLPQPTVASDFQQLGVANSSAAGIFGSQAASTTQAGSASAADPFGSRSGPGYPTPTFHDGPNGSPLIVRLKNALVRGVRAVLSVVVGAEVANSVLGGTIDGDVQRPADDRAAPREWEQPQGVTIGARLSQYLHLLFVVKFVMLWTFVFFYPQYTDRFSLLLLTFLSLFFATLLFSSHIGDGRMLVT